MIVLIAILLVVIKAARIKNNKEENVGS